MNEAEGNEVEQEEYDLMMELEQLETLKEEMEELGVFSLAEVESRMRDLHQQIDEMKRGGGSD